VRNVNRTVGTMLGSVVTRRYGADGLPDDTIDITLRGSAGQSLGAFLPRGITLRLVGDANDYVGKGLSGGIISARPDESARFAAEDNVLAGNVIGYGATSGAMYLRGVIGERFGVRNSGATLVCEGTGDHALEYMTGGLAVILGPTGRNLAAGMSGGFGYVLDLEAGRVNRELVDIEPLGESGAESLRAIVAEHATRTGSAVAGRLLADWPAAVARFSMLAPRDYVRSLRARPDDDRAADVAASYSPLAG
jgi:glutamate synthase (NADPH/NADH) large chain